MREGVPQSDLRRQMEKEAKREAAAEAEAAWHESLEETEHVEKLREIRGDMAGELHDTGMEIMRLERKLEQKKQKKETMEKRIRAVEEKMAEIDPEVVVEMRAYEHRGRAVVGREVKKAPPIPGRLLEDGPTIDGSRPASEVVDKCLREIDFEADPSSYDEGELIATVTFEDMEDDDPVVEWSEN